MIRLLNSDGIDTSKKRAIQLEYSDYNKYDLFIGMDKYNVSNMGRLFKSDEKIKLFHFFDNLNKDVEDPWYTSNFNSVYNEIKTAIPYIIDYLNIIVSMNLLLIQLILLDLHYLKILNGMYHLLQRINLILLNQHLMNMNIYGIKHYY